MSVTQKGLICPRRLYKSGSFGSCDEHPRL